MHKYEANYAKIEAMRKEHPGKTLKDLFNQADIDPSSYYLGKKAALNAKAKKAPPRKYAQIKAAEAPAPLPEKKADRLVFMMGTPEQIKAVLAGGAL